MTCTGPRVTAPSSSSQAWPSAMSTHALAVAVQGVPSTSATRVDAFRRGVDAALGVFVVLAAPDPAGIAGRTAARAGAAGRVAGAVPAGAATAAGRAAASAVPAPGSGSVEPAVP